MAYNVPAVYDVLPARIRALRSKDQGWQNVPEQRRGIGAQRIDLAVAVAEPLLRRSVNSPVMRSKNLYLDTFLGLDYFLILWFYLLQEA
jgi:hypothetical protein